MSSPRRPGISFFPCMKNHIKNKMEKLLIRYVFKRIIIQSQKVENSNISFGAFVFTNNHNSGTPMVSQLFFSLGEAASPTQATEDSKKRMGRSAFLLSTSILTHIIHVREVIRTPPLPLWSSKGVRSSSSWEPSNCLSHHHRFHHLCSLLYQSSFPTVLPVSHLLHCIQKEICIQQAQGIRISRFSNGQNKIRLFRRVCPHCVLA